MTDVHLIIPLTEIDVIVGQYGWLQLTGLLCAAPVMIMNRNDTDAMAGTILSTSRFVRLATMNITYKSIATLVLAFWMSFSANAQMQRNGTLKSVRGDVKLVQGQSVRAAEVGGGVQEADRIVTGRNASTTLTLKDGTIVTIGPKTTLELTKIQFDPTTQDGSLALNLLRGTLRMVTGLIGKLHPRQVNITTPTSVIGVRGTDFIVEVP